MDGQPQLTALQMTRIAGRLEKMINRDDELAGWSITRTPGAVTIVYRYRNGITHTIPISTADPDFINASL